MSRDLFDAAADDRRASSAPLAARMRPKSLRELLGQDHLLAPGAPLGVSLDRDRLWSAILWGPPGSGKTTLAMLAAEMTESRFISLSAVSAGVKEVRDAVEQAREELKMAGRRTVLFLDEVHRFNKAQQDALLPHVEDGTVIFWGATTENPYFEVIAPLLSRVRVLRLHPLEAEHVGRIVDAALADADRGLGGYGLSLSPEARGFILERTGGDARVALNWLEAAAEMAVASNDRSIAVETVERAVLQRQVHYDRQADEHYDTISAFIKSVRGSDPDAAVFWLAKMLRAGEQPEFIARRLMILASEDVGNADPGALPLAVAAAQAVERLGLPEATFALAQSAIYLASAAKSNSAGKALSAATEAIDGGADTTVPLHLRNPAFRAAASMGYGQGYLYSHDHPGHFVEQEFLPESVREARFFAPSGGGYEREMAARLVALWGERYRPDEESGPDAGARK